MADWTIAKKHRLGETGKRIDVMNSLRIFRVTERAAMNENPLKIATSAFKNVDRNGSLWNFAFNNFSVNSQSIRNTMPPLIYLIFVSILTYDYYKNSRLVWVS